MSIHPQTQMENLYLKLQMCALTVRAQLRPRLAYSAEGISAMRVSFNENYYL